MSAIESDSTHSTGLLQSLGGSGVVSTVLPHVPQDPLVPVGAGLRAERVYIRPPIHIYISEIVSYIMPEQNTDTGPGRRRLLLLVVLVTSSVALSYDYVVARSQADAFVVIGGAGILLGIVVVISTSFWRPKSDS